MTLFIAVEELIPNWKAPFACGELKGFHIDYATNAIHCWFGQEEVIIFRFKDYGWINENIYNKYEMSVDNAGITLTIQKP